VQRIEHSLFQCGGCVFEVAGLIEVMFQGAGEEFPLMF
jgi:hypothetical protein